MLDVFLPLSCSEHVVFCQVLLKARRPGTVQARAISHATTGNELGIVLSETRPERWQTPALTQAQQTDTNKLRFPLKMLVEEDSFKRMFVLKPETPSWI